jgi:hypothetical protein
MQFSTSKYNFIVFRRTQIRILNLTIFEFLRTC